MVPLLFLIIPKIQYQFNEKCERNHKSRVICRNLSNRVETCRIMSKSADRV